MLKAGVIGLGKMGISHCSIFNAHPDVNLSAVCDSSSLVLEAFKKYTNMVTYSDYKKMLDEHEVDFVVIATPTRLHNEMVQYALERGINVFCEKPFCLNVSEGAELVKTAQRNRLANQVGYHNRFLGTFREVKRLLESGVIGKPYHFLGEAYGPVVVKQKGDTWRAQRSEGGGCLYDYSSHVLNLIEFLIGTTVAVVGTSFKKIYSKDVDDAVYSTLTLDNGVSGSLSVNWSDASYRKMSTSITIIGLGGKIIADAQEVKIYLNHENEKERLKAGWNIKYITDLTTSVDFYLRGEEYSAQVDYFVDHVRNRELDNINSFESALATDRVIDLLLKSGQVY